MKVGRVFLSGCAVYVIVAACSAIDPAGQRGATSGRGDGGTASMASGAAGADGSSGLGGRPDVGVGDRGATGGSGSSGGSSGAIMDPVPEASADPVSGTRLKAVYVEGSDGSKAYYGGSWFDSELGVNCVTLTAADDRIRCMPPGGLNPSAGYYEDALCTVGAPAGPCASIAQEVYILTEAVGDTCSTRYHYRPFRRGAQLSTVYGIRSGACVAVDLPIGWTAYAHGSEMPPSSFVEITMRHD